MPCLLVAASYRRRRVLQLLQSVAESPVWWFPYSVWSRPFATSSGLPRPCLRVRDGFASVGGVLDRQVCVLSGLLIDLSMLDKEMFRFMPGTLAAAALFLARATAIFYSKVLSSRCNATTTRDESNYPGLNPFISRFIETFHQLFFSRSVAGRGRLPWMRELYLDFIPPFFPGVLVRRCGNGILPCARRDWNELG